MLLVDHLGFAQMRHISVGLLIGATDSVHELLATLEAMDTSTLDATRKFRDQLPTMYFYIDLVDQSLETSNAQMGMISQGRFLTPTELIRK
jgi:hypothetical protein